MFAAMAIVLEIAFWFVLLAVAAVFVTELIRGTVEDIRDHKRIAAARRALSAKAPPPERPSLPRQLLRSLHFR